MDTASRVRKVLSKALMVDDNLVVDNALLAEDLGITSLDRFELLVDLEAEFAMEIAEEDLEGVKTVGDVIARMERKTEGHEHAP